MVDGVFDEGECFEAALEVERIELCLADGGVLGRCGGLAALLRVFKALLKTSVASASLSRVVKVASPADVPARLRVVVGADSFFRGALEDVDLVFATDFLALEFAVSLHPAER